MCSCVHGSISLRAIRSRAHHTAIHPAISSFRAASGADTRIFEEKQSQASYSCVMPLRVGLARARAQLRQPRNVVQTDRGALLARVFRKRERSQRHATALDVRSRIRPASVSLYIERQRTRVSRTAGVRGRSGSTDRSPLLNYRFVRCIEHRV